MCMGIYRPPVTIDSNPDRALRQLPYKSLPFLVFFVYIPLLVFAIIIRALMLYHGYPVLNLTIVDDFVRQIILQTQNFGY